MTVKTCTILGLILLLSAPVCPWQKYFCAEASHHKKHQIIEPSKSSAKSSTTSNHHHHSGKHTSRHHLTHKKGKNRHIAAKTKYAYPVGIFLMHPPSFDSSPLPEDLSSAIKKAFAEGHAGDYPPRSLVRARIAYSYPMSGGIFWRREPIKYIIMHSTEPGIPVSAKTIIDGWSHGGRRHAGASYVVERDGTIYQAVDPDLATVHVNIFKTLSGINNDNSLGVEMCHHGSQDYPAAQLQSVVQLIAYLQSHYHVSDSNIITHRYAQQGDHTDPVNFAWDDFIAQKNSVQNQGLNYKLAHLKSDASSWQSYEEPVIAKDKQTEKTIEVTKSITPQLVSPIPVTSPVPGISQSQSVPQANVSVTSINPVGVNRLVPAYPIRRLVPVSMIINNRASANQAQVGMPASSLTPLINTAPNTSVIIPANITNIGNKTVRVLPLKGPIEMDPDEAASLLSQ